MLRHVCNVIFSAADSQSVEFVTAIASFENPLTLRRMPKVTVLPANVSAEVPPGETLLEAGEKAGVEMEAGCFNCSCGTCVVEVVSGMENLEPPSPEELDVLDAWNKDPEKYRLTCVVKILRGEVVIKAGH